MLLLLAALAAATDLASFTVHAGTPLDVRVDGRPLSYRHGLLTAALPPGRHVVDVVDATGELLYRSAFLVDRQAIACGWDTITLRCGGPEATVAIGYATGAQVVVTQPQVVVAPPPPVAPPPVAIPSEVKLVVRSQDGEWADVWVDGKKELELRNTKEGVITLRPGVHTVEITEFLSNEPYARGRLDTRAAARVTIGLTEGSPVQCYDHDGWTPL